MKVKVLEIENKGKQKKAKMNQLLIDLSSENETKIKIALEGLEIHGNTSVIEPIIEILSKKKNDIGKEHIKEFLSSLKSTNATNSIMQCVLNPKYSEQQQFILSTIWNSPIDYSEYLAEFVKIAVQKDFMHAFECLTIIENLEGPFEERNILESQLHLKDYLDGKFPKDSQKDYLISEIALLIKDFDKLTD
jgi:hypothetical protein